MSIFDHRRDKRTIGREYEAIACQYLMQQGLSKVAINYSSRFGELDLIMKDKSTWVFVEVKYRKSSQYGGAVAAVTRTKRRKILHTAYCFLNENGISSSNVAIRFDIVAINGNNALESINWIKNIEIES